MTRMALGRNYEQQTTCREGKPMATAPRKLRITLLSLLSLALLAIPAGAGTPVPVPATGRVSDVRGHLAVHGLGESAASFVDVNTVIRSGDTLWTDTDSQAEIELDSVWLRLAEIGR